MKTYKVRVRGVFRSARSRLDEYGSTYYAALMVLIVLLVGVCPASAAAAECPNEDFRVGASAHLPDCRAYEMSSPVNKGGGSLEGTIGQVKAADDGGGITFFSQAGIPGGVGAQEFPSFIATRGTSNWSTSGLLPPPQYGDTVSNRGFSPNLRYVATEVVKSGTLGEFVGEAALVLEDTSTHEIQTVVPYTEAAVSPAFILVEVTNSGAQVFFEAKVPLGTGAPEGQQNLFVWSRATGAISLVGVLPSGEKPEAGSFAGPYRWYENRLSSGGAFDNFYVSEEHAVAEGGNRAYFTAGGTGQLYLRTGLTAGNPTTVRVSTPEEGVQDPFVEALGEELPAAFLAATADGAKAFFMSHQKLTVNANTGTEDEGNDLYAYDAATGKLADLTGFSSAQTETLNGAEVQGALGISNNGSVIYFVANGVLAPGASPGSCSLQEAGGECNLYRYSDSGGAGRITFIARLNGSSQGRRMAGEARNWSPSSIRPSSNALFLEPTSRVSADGETVLFRSYRPLTGYDNTGCEALGEAEEGRCPEFFRYSAETSELVCVSCDPSGAAPVGAPSLRSRLLHVVATGGAINRLATQTRNLSSDGDQIFFETPDSLMPTDVNGEGGCQVVEEANPTTENSCQDVYEWEAQGAGSCVIATVPGGCLYLISSGQSRTSSNIADIDSSGRNVFFFTESQLVPADQDQLIDVYDARVDGGLSEQHPQPVGECTGEACQGNPPTAPGTSEPASSNVAGPENPKPKPPHKKKHHKRKHHKKKKHKAHGRKAKKCKKQGGHCNGKSSARRTADANRGGSR